MALFNTKIVGASLERSGRNPTLIEIEAAHEWAARVTSDDLDLQNESQLEQEFNRTVLQQVLGYVAPGAGQSGTMRVKQPIPGGTTVDVALGKFDGGDAAIFAPFELKGPKTPLDRIMPGRNKTPVQQAWDYPFREGNGRTQLIFLRQLGLRAGHPFRSEAVEADEFLTAMIDSFHGRMDALIDELERMRA